MNRAVFLSLLVIGLVANVRAQELTVQGSPTHANVPLGKAFQLEFEGTPSQPHLWYFDLDAGPTLIQGISVPLGFSPAALEIGGGTTLPASGRRTLNVGLSNNPSLLGVTVFSVAAHLDGNAPLGWAVSNGISFTIVGSAASAGPDGATLVGRSLTLDGSQNLQNGQLPSGVSLQWVLLGGPTGSTAALQNGQSAFPEFTPDVPGTYSFEVQVQRPSGLSADHVTVEAYALDFAAPLDGSFAQGSVNVQGAVAGPNVSTLEVNGQAVTIMPNGSFDAGMLTVSPLMNPVTARLTTTWGAVLERTVTVIGGTGQPLGTPGTPASSLRVGGASLDLLEPPVEAVLALLPLNQIITAIPPVPILNTPLFTATIAFTGASFDPNTVDFDIFPSNGNVGIALTLNQLNITSNLTGTIFFVPYAETATIAATSVTISGDLLIGSNAQGGIEVTIQNTTTTFVGFSFTATGALGGIAQLGALQTAVQGFLATSLSGLFALIPATLNPVLGALALSVNLSASGVPLQVDFPVNSVVYDTDGLTVASDFLATPLTTGPESPALTEVLTTPGSVPTFGTTTPVTGVPFDLAFATNDELLNQSFAALTVAGGLDLDFQGALGGGVTVLTAGNLAMLVPGAGFESFDAIAPVHLRLRHTTAPVVAFATSGPDAAVLQLGNARLVFSVELAPMVEVPVFWAGVTVNAGLNVAVDPQTSTLSLTPGTVTVTPSLGGGLAGTDPSSALAGLQTIVEQVLPQILAPLAQIPLPALFTGVPVLVEISVTPANADTLGTYFDLQ